MHHLPVHMPLTQPKIDQLYLRVGFLRLEDKVLQLQVTMAEVLPVHIP